MMTMVWWRFGIGRWDRRSKRGSPGGRPEWTQGECPGLIAFPELFIEARRARRGLLPAASVNNSAAKMSWHEHGLGFLLTEKTRIAWLRIPGLDVLTSD